MASNNEGSSVDHPRSTKGSVNRPSPATPLQGQDDVHSDHAGPSQQLEISRRRTQAPGGNRSSTAVKGPVTLQELYILENSYIDRRQMITQYDRPSIREEDYEEIKDSYYVKREPMKEDTKIYEGYQQFGMNERLPVAVKVIFPYKKKNDFEVKNLLTLKNHTNIVQILAAVYRSSPRHELSIVMELCSMDTLRDYVNKNRGKALDIDQTMEYNRHLVAGLEHIHDKGIIHRDLKPDNILFSPDRRILKIGDFGLSKQLQFGHSKTRTTRWNEGTDGYRAPETYERNEIEQHGDIFSLGLVMHVLWTGDHAYGSNIHLWVHLITTDVNQDKCDLSKLPNFPKRDNLHNLLTSMLKFLPKNRPSIKKVARSSFFKTDPQLEPRQLSVQNCRDQVTVPKQVFQPLISSVGEVFTDRAPIMPASQPELTVPPPIRSAKPNSAASSSTATAERNSSSLGYLDPPLEIRQENAQIGRGIHDEVSHEDEQAAAYAEGQIGPGGGKLEMGQYKLDLPPTALLNETTLLLNEYRSFEEKPLPEGYQHISSIIRCRPTNTKLEVNGNLTMPLNISLAEGMEPIILHSKDQHSPWYNHSTPTPVRENVDSVTFKISRLGWYVVALNVAGHKSSQIKLKNYLYYKTVPPQMLMITQLAGTDPPALEDQGFSSVFEVPDCIVMKSNEEIRYQLVCQSPIECKLSPATEVKLTGDVINANESKWTTFYLKPPPSRNQKYVHIQYIVSEPNLTQKRQSDFPIKWNSDMDDEQLPAAAYVAEPETRVTKLTFSRELRKRDPIETKKMLHSQALSISAGSEFENELSFQVRQNPNFSEFVSPLADMLPDVENTQLAECKNEATMQSVIVLRSTRKFYESHVTDDDIYQMDPNRMKGTVLIINNKFDQQPNLERFGSEVDVENMELLWNGLGFEVQIKTNLTAEEIIRNTREFAGNADNVSCVAVMVMTHGGRSEYDHAEYCLGEDGGRVILDDITKFFTSSHAPHLCGIPKLLMYQMCRGNDKDTGTGLLMTDSPALSGRFPDRADMLILYPSQSGFVSYRNSLQGSWLINAITKVFGRHAHDTHMLDMLTMVNRDVGRMMAPSHKVGLQLSNQLSYFRKKLFLFPGWPY